jgi:hypothetical protein
MKAGSRGAGEAWQVVSRQPGWITRAVLTLFLLLIALPFLVLFVFAIIAAAVLLFVLAAVNATLASVRRLFGGDAGGGLAGASRPGAAAGPGPGPGPGRAASRDAGHHSRQSHQAPSGHPGRDGRENVRVVRRD